MEKLKLIYSVEKEEWLEGYDLSYNLYRKKFTYIKAAIFLIPLLLFIEQLFHDPKFIMGYVCIAVCIGAIACIFATPKMERAAAERALDGIAGDTYQMTLTEENITFETVKANIGEELLEQDADGKTVELPKTEPVTVSLSDKSFRAIETEKIVGVFTKGISYVLPKSQMNDYDLDTLRKGLKI